MIYKNLLDKIGNTPIIRFDTCQDSRIRGFIKLEGENPSGSVKDRPALALIKSKIQSGELNGDKTILDASSGSFACSVSMIGKILGYKVKVITGYKMTEDKIAFIKYFGGNMVSHGNFTIEGNRYCREELLTKEPEKYCFLDQLHNWKNPQAHYETTGPEILRDLPNVSAVVFSLGSGGTLNGVSRYLRENKPDTKIIAVTASTGVKIPGIGAFVDGDYSTPFIDNSKSNKYFDYVAEVKYKDAVVRVKELAKQGFFVGIQTGAVYQGLLDAVNNLNLSGDVLIISGDAGWKNMDKLITL
jgi:[CysO sulfur-carrier protein]-thiocarboxylate-dependent cysteine synthase